METFMVEATQIERLGQEGWLHLPIQIWLAVGRWLYLGFGVQDRTYMFLVFTATMT